MGIIKILLGIPPAKPKYKLSPRQVYYREVYLQSEHWKNFKRGYWLRHPYATCVKCGAGRPLDLHHLNYNHLYRETDKDVVPLCRVHHDKEHKRKR